MKTFSQFQEEIKNVPSVRELGGLGGGGGGTDSITDKSPAKSFKKRVGDVAKVLTFPFHKRRKDPTEKFATEGVAALATGGSKLIPALMTGIGAAGTIMQAKRGRPEGGAAKRYKRNKPKRKISDMERKLTDRIDKQNVGIERKGKAFDTTGLDLYKKSKLITPKNGQVIQDEFSAPTNNASSGNIAGLPPDPPPLKRKKRYIYGGTGSRKMWMNNK